MGKRIQIRRGRRATLASARAGMTMLEIAIAVTVLAVGLGSAVYSLLTASALERSTREQALALQGAESCLEMLQSTNFPETFLRFNGTDADDPAAGDSPGNDFDVEGLSAWPGDPDGLPGEILFPGDGVGLFENVAMPQLGMPRDLTLDEPPVIDGIDHALEYRVLPVLVRVRWTGARGNRELVLGTTLNNERKTP
jgi:type II secretory pathway pseudopilin PulG